MLTRKSGWSSLGACLLLGLALGALGRPAASAGPGLLHAAPALLALLAPTPLVVVNTQDAGPGSLRAAIEDANASPDADTIRFRIPITDPGFAGGVFTIQPVTALPAVQHSAFIDGASQLALTGNTNPAGPEIVLNGVLAGDASGLRVEGSDSTVRDLVINGFRQAGLRLGGSNNRVEGCYIGTNATGAAAVPNGADGIVFGGSSHRIGGTEARLRNVVSGNGAGGIVSFGVAGSLLVGNHVGTNAPGTSALPNAGPGIFLQSAFDTRIGGTAVGSRNVISGNADAGIILESGNGNQVQGNFIGTDASGTAALPNRDGVSVSQSGSVLVGGSETSARNVISGNREDGVVFTGGTTNSQVQGNFIGTNAAGAAALPNGESGVQMEDGRDNLVGGTTTAARNIISGNAGDGVTVLFNTTDNIIQGNYIGTNSVGRAALPNGAAGVRITDGAQRIQVGGTGSGAGNLISGNAQSGVLISGEVLTDPGAPAGALNVVQGNLIGTDYSGDRPLPNGGDGVSLDAGTRRNLIGGASNGARNVISGNTRSGVSLDGLATEENEIAGNFIGSRVLGTVALPNGGSGVALGGGATNNLIGGTTAASRNVISGNLQSGVSFAASGSLNRLQGNYIGTNVHGSGALPNEHGVIAFGPAGPSFNDIGGDAPGAGNVISGNRGAGVSLENTHRFRVRGNLVGTNAAGTAALGNGFEGVGIGNASVFQIGGAGPNERNLISGNGGDGVNIGRGTTGVHVEGNLIGLNLSGAGAVPNQGYGVVLFEVSENTVGGTAAGSRNVISGNRKGGVWIASGAENNDVQGNYVGTNSSGTLAVPNSGHGVLIEQSEHNRIGGSAAGTGNVISGNAGDGVHLWAFGFDFLEGNRVEGNRIGTVASGAGPLPNRGSGVVLRGEALRDNRVGGTGPGEANQIAYNLGDGVLLTATAEDDPTLFGNPIRANSIHDNRGLGINLRPPGEPAGVVTPNDFQDPHPGVNRLQNFPVLTQAQVQPGLQTTLVGTLNSTPGRTFALDFFRSPAPDPSGFGEGRDYLGSFSVATDTSGNASFTFVAGVGEAGFFTATATDLVTGDTGEFSAALAGTAAGAPLTARAFRAPSAGLAVVGRVTDPTGVGLPGVRIILANPDPTGPVFSRDFDPDRLYVTHTDAQGRYRFTGLSRRRFLVRAYAPGVGFHLGARVVEPGAGTSLDFTGRADGHPPAITAKVPRGAHGAVPGWVAGTVRDAGGAGVRMVLVRLKLVDQGPDQWLDWSTGVWSPGRLPSQCRRATLDGNGGWKVDLPRLTAGKFELEVQALDAAGQASPRILLPFEIPAGPMGTR